jgi:nucleoside-diphosphate-sugar epimerase
LKTVLITGAAGFIGSHLANFYLQKNNRVIGIDNFLTGSKKNIRGLNNSSLFSFHEMDVCEDWNSLPDSVSRAAIDLVFHLASPAAVNQYQQHSLETLWVNSVGLKNALQFADSKKARLVFSSTSEIYGSLKTSPQNEKDWGHVNSYGERSCYDEAKRFGEALIYSSNKKNQTLHGLVRIFNTYGPAMNEADGRVIIQFIRQALRGENLSVYGTGFQTRSFCYIDDLIQGLVNYAESNFTEPLNLGDDTEIKILDLAQLILDLTASSSKIDFKSLPADDPPQRRPDLALARQKLNYQTTTPLIQGLKQLIASLKN